MIVLFEPPESGDVCFVVWNELLARFEQLYRLDALAKDEEILDAHKRDVVNRLDFEEVAQQDAELVMLYYFVDLVETSALASGVGASADSVVVGWPPVGAVVGRYDPVLGDDGPAADRTAFVLDHHLVWEIRDRGVLAIVYC